MADPIAFDVTAFRSQFPAFQDANRFPDNVLQQYFNTATCYLTNRVSGRPVDCLTRECRTLALNQMTAHLCQLSQDAAAGKNTGFKTSASVGSVSTSVATPPFNQSTLAYWLSSSPYGQALLALLRTCTASGYYIGGRCERAAFRKVGGYF